MSEQSTDELAGVVKRADQLAAGDLVVEVPEYGQPPRPMRVLMAHPFKDANNNRMVSLVLDALDEREPMYVRTTAGAKYETEPAPPGSEPSANPYRRCHRCGATSGLKTLFGPFGVREGWQCWDDCRESR